MNKKNKKKITFISITIFALLFFITVGLFSVVISLGILPLKYLLPILIVLGLIYLSIGKIIFNKRIKSWVKMFLDVICIIFIIIYIFIYYYLNSTLHFMDRIKAGKYQVDNYYILVEKGSSIKELSDIEVLGIYDSDDKNYNDAIDKLNEEITYESTSYDNYIDLGNSLLKGNVDAILMSASYKDILSEMINDFENNVEIIYTVEIKSESGIEASDVNITKEPFNIYISGIDIFGDISMVSRSDVNMIMTVNPKTHKILLTSIPRDYYVRLHGTTGYKDKLTHAGLYGINMSIETIEDLLEEDIDYYIRVNFTTLINLVDAIGGIDVYSDTAFTAWTDRSCTYKVGKMHLYGKCALAYARERKVYDGGDRHRVKNQQEVLAAIINKALSSRTLTTKYTNILKSMGNSFQTNIPTEKIYDLINMQLDKMPSWSFDNYSLNGFDSSNYTYTFPNEDLYVMNPDVSTVEEAKIKIDTVMKSK